MAIKIIKPGKFKNPKDTRRFLCLNCGCVFMADVDDYEEEYSLRNDYYLKIECPCCGYIIRKSCNE